MLQGLYRGLRYIFGSSGPLASGGGDVLSRDRISDKSEVDAKV